MLFGMVSGVSQGIRVLDGVVIIEGEVAVLGVNLGHPTVSSGHYATRLLPNRTLGRTCCCCTLT